jgi:hypothetical protein
MNTHFGIYSLWQWALLAIPSQQHPLPVKSNQTIHGLPAGVRRESIVQLPAQGQSATRAIRRRFAQVVLNQAALDQPHQGLEPSRESVSLQEVRST